MVAVESRPFLTPLPGAVRADVTLVEPRCDLVDLARQREPGERVVLRVDAEIDEQFWSDTCIPPEEGVKLVAVVTCLSARSRWRSEAAFATSDIGWSAAASVEVPGDAIAVELTVDVWVVGRGRTGPGPDQSTHPGAKLWELAPATRLQLEDDRAAFPTTALSFGASGRRNLPWTVETANEAEPGWNCSAAIRLYVNTDLEIHRSLLDGTASEDLMALLECDIHQAVLHRLAHWADMVNADQMLDIAEERIDSLAALGAQISAALGLTLGEALKLISTDPLELTMRSREALRFGRREGE